MPFLTILPQPPLKLEHNTHTNPRLAPRRQVIHKTFAESGRPVFAVFKIEKNPKLRPSKSKNPHEGTNPSFQFFRVRPTPATLYRQNSSIYSAESGTVYAADPAPFDSCHYFLKREVCRALTGGDEVSMRRRVGNKTVARPTSSATGEQKTTFRSSADRRVYLSSRNHRKSRPHSTAHSSTDIRKPHVKHYGKICSVTSAGK